MLHPAVSVLARRCLLLCAVLGAAVLAPATTAAGASTTVSLAFDDGRANQYTARSILSSHGMAATFYVNSGRIGTNSYYMTWPQLHALQADGNEIGGHTRDHSDLTELPPDQQRAAICDDRSNLLGRGFSPVRSFSYPYLRYTATTKRIVAECGYSSARIDGAIRSASCPSCPFAEAIPPPDPYLVRAPDDVRRSDTLDTLKGYVTQAENNGGGWVILAFHSVCDGCDGLAVRPGTLAALLSWLRERSSQGTVVRTVGDVMDDPPPDAPPSPPSAPPASPQPDDPPPAGELATTRPPGSPSLSDVEAASQVRRSPWEPRWENHGANHRKPTSSELTQFYAYDRDFAPCEGHHHRVTGGFEGTTDEIIQWAAWKWGIDEDVVRAVAAEESYWRQSVTGDNGYSHGLMQVKRPTGAPYVGWRGTHPLSALSTAFNVDFWAMTIRYYYDGCATWLGGGYAPGDFWGSIGTWYSGGWHDWGGERYISDVKAVLRERTWEQPGF